MGDKFNGNITFYIRGQREVLKVQVIWVSKIALGDVLTIDYIHYI